MTKTTEKKGFIGRVLDKLTGGDEAKVTRFQTKAVKFYTTQVGIRKNEVEDLDEKINDLVEKYEETLLNVDLEAIKTSEGLESYIPSYTKKALGVKKEIEAVKAEIIAKNAEIVQFEELIADLKA